MGNTLSISYGFSRAALENGKCSSRLAMSRNEEYVKTARAVMTWDLCVIIEQMAYETGII
jgi:hypothetical protein